MVTILVGLNAGQGVQVAQHAPPTLLAQFGREAAAGVVGVTLGVIAGAITLVALSFALYAAFKCWVSPAAASALTALVYAVIAVAVATLVPRFIRGSAQRRSQVKRPPIDPNVLRAGTEIGLVLLGALAESMAR